jgi:hypothetical protein
MNMKNRTLHTRRRMKRKYRILPHLRRALAVDGLPCRVRGEGELVGSDPDSVAVFDVQLEELMVESPPELIPTPGQAGCCPQRWTGEALQGMEEDIVDYVEGYPSTLEALISRQITCFIGRWSDRTRKTQAAATTTAAEYAIVEMRVLIYGIDNQRRHPIHSNNGKTNLPYKLKPGATTALSIYQKGSSRMRVPAQQLADRE